MPAIKEIFDKLYNHAYRAIAVVAKVRLKEVLSVKVKKASNLVGPYNGRISKKMKQKF